jgi:hypothetical protein
MYRTIRFLNKDKIYIKIILAKDWAKTKLAFLFIPLRIRYPSYSYNPVNTLLMVLGNTIMLNSSIVIYTLLYNMIYFYIKLKTSYFHYLQHMLYKHMLFYIFIPIFFLFTLVCIIYYCWALNIFCCSVHRTINFYKTIVIFNYSCIITTRSFIILLYFFV